MGRQGRGRAGTHRAWLPAGTCTILGSMALLTSSMPRLPSCTSKLAVRMPSEIVVHAVCMYAHVADLGQTHTLDVVSPQVHAACMIAAARRCVAL